MWLIKWIAFYYTTDSCELIASLSRGTEGACFSWQLCRHWAPMGVQVHTGVSQKVSCASCCSKHFGMAAVVSGVWVKGRGWGGHRSGEMWVLGAFDSLGAWLPVTLHGSLGRWADPHYQPGYIATYILKLILCWVGNTLLLIKTCRFWVFSFHPPLSPMSLLTVLPHCQAVVIRFHCLLPAFAWSSKVNKLSWLFHSPCGNSQFCGFCCMIQLMLAPW